MLRYVGKVGTGITDAQHRWLNTTMRARSQPKPSVACPIKGKWIQPGLFCKVSFLEMSENGELRMPVLEELKDEAEVPAAPTGQPLLPQAGQILAGDGHATGGRSVDAGH